MTLRMVLLALLLVLATANAQQKERPITSQLIVISNNTILGWEGSKPIAVKVGQKLLAGVDFQQVQRDGVFTNSIEIEGVKVSFALTAPDIITPGPMEKELLWTGTAKKPGKVWLYYVAWGGKDHWTGAVEFVVQ